MVRKHWIENKA